MAAQSTVRAVCLMGPTAAGKTGVAIELLQAADIGADFELISVDSAQVYRHMNIGTAKPSADVLREFPHRLINIRDPWESYSAGNFCRDVTAAMHDISAQNKVPLLVGGTMLYFQALQQGLAELPAADPDLRARLDAAAERDGWPSLHRQLAELDPVTAERLKPTDSQRIQRALEVCLLSGKALSELQKNTRPPIQASYLNVGLLPSDRAQLHARIEARLTAMLTEGFMDELQMLSELPGMSAATPAMRAVGYRQLWPCLNVEADAAQALEKAVTATRRLAKRQLTWLRSWPDLQVVDCLSDNAASEVGEIVKTWLDVGATAGISR